ncbi:hypothetical protein PFISCL1PPCAC_18864, partial [Pristionchus fissidentatus]
SWHVIHAVANISGRLVTHSWVHIMKETEQDSTAVAAIIEHALTDMHTMGITGVHIRSDNAGYYHSSATIGSLPSIAAKTKVKILSWSFSEAQAGKAASDRIASFVKRKMRSYKDATHNVVTPEEMFYAINSTKQLRGVSVYVANVVEEKKSTTKIPHISD